MLSNVYYFFGIFILLSVISHLLNFNRIFKVIEWYNKFEKVTNKKATKTDFRDESDWNLFISRNILSIVEGLWTIFGLITNNWFIFVLLVVYGKIISFLFGGIKNSIVLKYIYLHLYIIKALLYGLMIINEFHLQLDLWIIFKDFLQSQ